ncbi:putative Copia protein (Gag-int-pol protein) [Daphnia magna]|uniref:Putative Copia protein (Gag-int-pol protein) n=1 Tax=Daphnia magna TaxID=35525 RepID=A0A164FCJ1_9CRUS|nr:putative Copia protein (Gag-int-pol protein) [Daphnia magna]
MSIIPQPLEEQPTRRSKRQLPYVNYKEDTSDGSEIEEGTRAVLETMVLEHDPSTPYSPVSALLLEPYLPISFNDAMSCPESKLWKEVIQEEYKSLMENKTWDIVPLPQCSSERMK